jgi:hypothetical protein
MSTTIKVDGVTKYKSNDDGKYWKVICQFTLASGTNVRLSSRLLDSQKLFEDYDLPRTREELKALLAGNPVYIPDDVELLKTRDLLIPV